MSKEDAVGHIKDIVEVHGEGSDKYRIRVLNKSEYNPDDYRMFVLIARASGGGPTAAKEIVTGLSKLTEMAQEFLESDHDVEIYECVEKEFEITTQVTVTFHD